MSKHGLDVIIIGGGIGGLTAALALQDKGVRTIRIYEAHPEVRPLGVGIHMQPHATRVLVQLGLHEGLAAAGIETRERAFFTHHGQRVFSEPTGLFAGYPYPQFTIHRGDLLMVLFEAAKARLGEDNIICNHRCVGVEAGDRPIAHFVDASGRVLEDAQADVIIAADGIHSRVRAQFYPDEGEPRYHGINMWRGVTRSKPFLDGRTSVRVGGLHATGKMVIYPIRDNIDDQGRQLINWNVDVVSEQRGAVDWGQAGRMEDFYHLIENWNFDWLDAAALVRNADFILSFPMVDRDPVTQWAFGNVVLMGDAAHPMFPRGGNGGASAILDAASLAEHLTSGVTVPVALKAFETERVAIVNTIVETNRRQPPDFLIDEVERRTKGARFDKLDDVISEDDLRKLSEQYKRIAMSDIASVIR